MRGIVPRDGAGDVIPAQPDAILMFEEAAITEPRINELQEGELLEVKAILQE